jgi:hypothetical protein
LSGGVAWAKAHHENFATNSFVGATLGLHAGYSLTPRWALGLDFNAVEKSVTRSGSNFTTDSLVEPQGGCGDCLPPDPGGVPTNTMLLLCVFGPLAEFTPFGPNGFYVGASGGFAFMQLVEYFPGVGGTLRTGYRFQPLEMFNLGLEAGLRGQWTEGDGSGMSVYGAALFRPRF